MNFRLRRPALLMALTLAAVWGFAAPLPAQESSGTAPTAAEAPAEPPADSPRVEGTENPTTEDPARAEGTDTPTEEGPAPAPAAGPQGPPEKPRAVEPGNELVGIGSEKFKIHPFITEQLWWDDNIFLEDENHDSDRYIDQRVGVLADYRSTRFDLDLGYTTAPRHYFHHSEADFTENFADLIANLKPGQWHITGEGHFSQTFNAIDTLFASIQEIQTYTGALEVGADYERLAFFQRWDHVYTIFGNPANRASNNTRDRFTSDISYRFWEKTSAVVRYLYETRDFENKILDDSTRNQYMAGLRGELFTKMTYEFLVGYDDVGYEQDSGTLPFTENSNGISVSASLKWNPTEKIEFTLAYDRDPRQSTATHFIMSDQVVLGYAHRWSERFKTKVDILWQKAVESNQSVAGADTTRLWNSASATYALTKWLDAEIGYKYRISNTNDGTGEYDNNQAWIGATLRF